MKAGGAWDGPTIPFDPEQFKEAALAFVQEADVRLAQQGVDLGSQARCAMVSS